MNNRYTANLKRKRISTNLLIMSLLTVRGFVPRHREELAIDDH